MQVQYEKKEGTKGVIKSQYPCDELSVVYASDDRFAEILGVSLTSLYENNKDFGNITIYIFESNISEEKKEKIEQISNAYNRPVPVWIVARDISKDLSMEVAIDRGSLTQYARLFVHNTLPKNLHRVLYLDCDIIINQGLSEFWNLDLQGKTVAALKDAFSASYRRNIDLEPNDVMFNSGVMLIDLDAWRENHIEKRLIQFIKKHKGRIQQGDQGALNAVLSDSTYCFDPKFNTVTIFYDFTYNEMLAYRKPPKDFYTQEEIINACKHPVIIHYTTSMFSRRPWIQGSNHIYLQKWMHYKKLSPFADMPLWPYNEKKSKVALLKIYKGLPRNMSVTIAGLFQAYFRPWSNTIKDKLTRG